MTSLSFVLASERPLRPQTELVLWLFEIATSAALSGLEIFFLRLTQGVALGYHLSGFQPFHSVHQWRLSVHRSSRPVRSFAAEKFRVVRMFRG